MAEPVAKSNTRPELTRDQIQAVINQKLENTIYWLNKAYDHRPEDSQTEKTLLDLLAKISRLKTDANTQLMSEFGPVLTRSEPDQIREVRG